MDGSDPVAGLLGWQVYGAMSVRIPWNYFNMYNGWLKHENIIQYTREVLSGTPNLIERDLSC